MTVNLKLNSNKIAREMMAQIRERFEDKGEEVVQIEYEREGNNGVRGDG